MTENISNYNLFNKFEIILIANQLANKVFKYEYKIKSIGNITRIKPIIVALNSLKSHNYLDFITINVNDNINNNI